MPILIDSYSESNQDSEYSISAAWGIGAGQSFTGDGGTLNSAVFYINKGGLPTGYAYAKIYTHSGTFGTSSLPTGSPLATSDAVDVSTLSATLVLTTFTFNDANKITLTNETKYVVTLEFVGGDGGNYIGAGYDKSSPTHEGNFSYEASGSWYADNDNDLCFYVYRDEMTYQATMEGTLSFAGGLNKLVPGTHEGLIRFSGALSKTVHKITSGIIQFRGTLRSSGTWNRIAGAVSSWTASVSDAISWADVSKPTTTYTDETKPTTTWEDD